MDTVHEQVLEDSIDIAASPGLVWDLVGDVRRMPAWSPQVESVRLRDGFADVALGTEFTNLNREGDLEWRTHGEIVRWEPERVVAFRIVENWAIWSFHLAPTDAGGTLLTQRRDTPEGLSELSLQLADAYLGGQAAFTTILRAGMRETLERIRAAAQEQHR